MNGYKNRSTFLAVLHLDNTNLEVWRKAVEIGRAYKGAIEYWQGIKERDPMSYSYPFHQVKAVEQALKNLLSETGFNTEQDRRLSDVCFQEVAEHFMPEK